MSLVAFMDPVLAILGQNGTWLYDWDFRIFKDPLPARVDILRVLGINPPRQNPPGKNPLKKKRM